jgi:AbrB family looped-hinge helix DNA binding protein
MESTITIKGQATIPKAVRQHLGLKAGGSTKVLLPPGWQRSSAAETLRADITGHGQIPAPAASNNRSNDQDGCRRGVRQHPTCKTPMIGLDTPKLSPSPTELRRSGPMPEWQSQAHSCRCLRLAPSDVGWCRPCYVSLLPSMGIRGIRPPVVHAPIAQ